MTTTPLLPNVPSRTCLRPDCKQRMRYTGQIKRIPPLKSIGGSSLLVAVAMYVCPDGHEHGRGIWRDAA